MLERGGSGRRFQYGLHVGIEFGLLFPRQKMAPLLGQVCEHPFGCFDLCDFLCRFLGGYIFGWVLPVLGEAVGVVLCRLGAREMGCDAA